MYLIVVGAGLVGSSLIKLALNDGHDVALIERDEQRAQEAAQKFDALVLHADIAQGNIFEEADIGRADALIATTSDDATNLMVMFLGKEYGVKMLLSLVNVKEHQGMFKTLGVQMVVDPEKIVAQHLYDRLRIPKAEDVITLAHGEQLFEAAIGATSPLIGRTTADVMHRGLLSRKLIIISIRRDNETILLPADDVTLQVGDHLIVFSQKALSGAQSELFTG